MEKQLSRIAPYVTLVCALVLIVVTIERSVGGADATSVSGSRQVVDPGAPGRPTVAGGPSRAPGGSTPGPIAVAPVVGSGPGGGTNTGGAAPQASVGVDAGVPADDTGGSDAGSVRADPGLGTDEALANPECDPTTGRIRFPTPFAPACVRPFPEGAANGGATSTGVTADSIRVSVLLPPSGPQSDPEAIRTEVLASLDIFESHYEMWGRELDLEFKESSGTDEVAQRADAVEMYNDHQPFFAFHAGQNPYPVWAAELAARGVLSAALTERWEATQDQPGFRWAANPDDRLTWAHATEYVAKRLQGAVPEHAGPGIDPLADRVIGVLYPEWWDLAAMKAQAEAVGADIAVYVSYPDGDPVTVQNQAATLIAKLRDGGATTVVNAVDIVSNVIITKAATQSAYFPEWIVTGWGNHDTAVAGKLFDPSQWEHAFGFGPVQPLLPDEHYDLTNLYRWHHGIEPPEPAVLGQTRLIAHVMMTGLHTTGPVLTPETFRAGLFAAPPAGGSSCDCRATVQVSYGTHLSLSWDDYTGFDDVTEKWWDGETLGQDEIGITAPGVYWKVDGGRRYFPGGWQSGTPKVFTTDGAVERFDEPPPGEELPEYEHQPHDE